MACEAEHRPLGVFECQLCALAAPYSYVGQKPPDTQSVILLEESYVMKDPFTPDKDRFLILGSRCSVCGRLVCVGPVGMQSVLLQEVLPPLCPEEPPGFPPGDPAGPGEKERPREEAGRPAQLAGLSRRRRRRRPRSGAELGATLWPCSGAAQRRHLGTPPRLQRSLSAERGQEPRGAQALKGLGPHPLQVLPAVSCSTWLGWRALRPFHEGSDPGVVSTRYGALLGPEHSRAGQRPLPWSCPHVRTSGPPSGRGERVLPLALVPAPGPRLPPLTPSPQSLLLLACPSPQRTQPRACGGQPHSLSIARGSSPPVCRFLAAGAAPSHLTVAAQPPSQPRVRNVNKEPFPSIVCQVYSQMPTP